MRCESVSVVFSPRAFSLPRGTILMTRGLGEQCDCAAISSRLEVLADSDPLRDPASPKPVANRVGVLAVVARLHITNPPQNGQSRRLDPESDIGYAHIGQGGSDGAEPHPRPKQHPYANRQLHRVKGLPGDLLAQYLVANPDRIR